MTGCVDGGVGRWAAELVAFDLANLGCLSWVEHVLDCDVGMVWSRQIAVNDHEAVVGCIHSLRKCIENFQDMTGLR